MAEKSKQPSAAKKATQRVKQDAEKGARRGIMEDLFYDFHRSRAQVYKMNFFRGIFFGFGSVLGATLLVAISIWILGQFGDIFPPIADFINTLTDTMQRRR